MQVLDPAPLCILAHCGLEPMNIDNVDGEENLTEEEAYLSCPPMFSSQDVFGVSFKKYRTYLGDFEQDTKCQYGMEPVVGQVKIRENHRHLLSVAESTLIDVNYSGTEPQLLKRQKNTNALLYLLFECVKDIVRFKTAKSNRTFFQT